MNQTCSITIARHPALESDLGDIMNSPPRLYLIYGPIGDDAVFYEGAPAKLFHHEQHVEASEVNQSLSIAVQRQPGLAGDIQKIMNMPPGIRSIFGPVGPDGIFYEGAGTTVMDPVFKRYGIPDRLKYPERFVSREFAELHMGKNIDGEINVIG